MAFVSNPGLSFVLFRIEFIIILLSRKIRSVVSWLPPISLISKVAALITAQSI